MPAGAGHGGGFLLAPACLPEASTSGSGPQAPPASQVLGPSRWQLVDRGGEVGRIERSVCGCGLDTPVIRPLPPNPQRLSVTYLGSRALGRWPRQNEVIRVGPRPVRLVFLTRRGDREADSQRGDPVSARGWGGRHPRTEQRGRRRNRPRSRLDLGLPASWAVGRCCSVTEAPGHGTLSGPPAGPTFIPGDRSPAVDVSGSCPMGFVL